MASITQTTPNLLGGVSTQSDVKKAANQVREAINVHIDPAYGLCKRHGSRYIKTLGTEAEFKDSYFTFYRRDELENYLVAVSKGSIRAFNLLGMVEATITASPAALDYLTKSDPSIYRSQTIQDNTIILNRDVEVKSKPNPNTFVPNSVGTVRIWKVEYGATYTITIDGTYYSYKTRNGDDPTLPDTFLNADEILTELKKKIDAANIPGLTVTKLDVSLEFKKDIAFTLDCVGGISNDALQSYQDSAQTIDIVPPKSIDNRVVRILNSNAKEDDYFIKYNKSKEAWEETLDPLVDSGLDASTMPHELILTGVNTFEFKPIDWEPRRTGDDTTNPLPSFVGGKIEGVFFSNNRLGFLSGPNVVSSQTSDYYNFFGRSALTAIESDPIDINCNSTVPTRLSYALPVPSGILLFSDRQQFLMTADNSTYTPSTTFIRQISSYELDEKVPAIDLGNYQVFIAKTSDSTKVYSIQVPDVNQPPSVFEVSMVVRDYIPNTIDNIISNPESETFFLSSRSGNSIYVFSRYSNGSEDLMQAWYKWNMTGKVIDFFVTRDVAYVITTQAGETVVCQVDTNESSNVGVISNHDAWSNTYLDCLVEVNSPTYDPINKSTKVYTPYKHVTGLQSCVIDNDTGNNQSGWFLDSINTGTDTNGNWHEFRGDLTSISKLKIGYRYAMTVEYPEFFLKGDRGADYTAHLTVSRLRFSVGLTGALGFKLKSKGRSEWYDVQPVVEGNYYLADSGPLADRYTFTLPIHQRSTNFNVKSYSDTPFPVCINMMTWEGIYSQKFYRRT